MVISIGLIGRDRASLDYYLDRTAGCAADYYLGRGEPAGRWVGAGAAALGLAGPLDAAGEQLLRGLLDGVGPDGTRLVAPVPRADPRGKLAAAPLIAAIGRRASERGVPAAVLLGDDRLVEVYHVLLAPTVRAGERTGARPGLVAADLAADLAGRLAGAGGLDPVAVYRGADGTDHFSAALAQVGRRVDVRRPGLDVTISAPKSVSVLYALGSPEVAAAVRAAHTVAVGEALGYLERNAGHGLRGHQGDGARAARVCTEGFLGAAFEHRTSRAGDPQLHTHLVIANLVHGTDGAWSAGQPGALSARAERQLPLPRRTARSAHPNPRGGLEHAPARCRRDCRGSGVAAPAVLHPPGPDRGRAGKHRPRRCPGRATGLSEHPGGQARRRAGGAARALGGASPRRRPPSGGDAGGAEPGPPAGPAGARRAGRRAARPGRVDRSADQLRPP